MSKPPTKFRGGPYRRVIHDRDLTVYNGDALEVLKMLPDESVHCAITSPPFFGLRDYDVDGQLGREDSLGEWADKLVEVFAETRRILRRDGSLWVECGDSYNTGTRVDRKVRDTPSKNHGYWTNGAVRNRVRDSDSKPKDVLGQPFILAFALRDNGWWWRGWYPWIKRNALPESAKDRLSVCSSMVFQFARESRYYFDGEAIEEPAAWEYWGRQGLRKLDASSGARGASMRFNEFGRDEISKRETKWPRGWFDIPTRSNSLAICSVCGAFWERDSPEDGLHCGVKLVSHYAAFPEALVERIMLAASPRDGVVLDPFLGSGTVALVARKLHRRCIGIELNENYCAMTAHRTQQLSLEGEAVA